MKRLYKRLFKMMKLYNIHSIRLAQGHEDKEIVTRLMICDNNCLVYQYDAEYNLIYTNTRR